MLRTTGAAGLVGRAKDPQVEGTFQEPQGGSLRCAFSAVTISGCSKRRHQVSAVQRSFDSPTNDGGGAPGRKPGGAASCCLLP